MIKRTTQEDMHHHLQEKLSWKLPMTDIGAATEIPAMASTVA